MYIQIVFVMLVIALCGFAILIMIFGTALYSIFLCIKRMFEKYLSVKDADIEHKDDSLHDDIRQDELMRARNEHYIQLKSRCESIMAESVSDDKSLQESSEQPVQIPELIIPEVTALEVTVPDEQELKIEEPDARVKELTELTQFYDMIGSLRILGELDYHFYKVATEALNVGSICCSGDSFIDNVIANTKDSDHYTSRTVYLIARMIKEGATNDEIESKLLGCSDKSVTKVNQHPEPQNKLEAPIPVTESIDSKPDEPALSKGESKTIEEKRTEEKVLSEIKIPIKEVKNKELPELKSSVEPALSKGESKTIEEKRTEEKRTKEKVLSEIKTPIKEVKNNKLPEVKSSDELLEFQNTIFHVKFLGLEDNRFDLVALKSHDLITLYGDSQNFYNDALEHLYPNKDFTSEVIIYIIKQKKRHISDVELIRKIRSRYMMPRDTVEVKKDKIALNKNNEQNQVKYIEAELVEASKKLRAKAKIAHKHKAIQYANIIGGELADGFRCSSHTSFYDYLKEHCTAMASKGSSSLTSDDFHSAKNIVFEYKRSKLSKNGSTVDTNITVPQYRTDDEKVSSLLNILSRLTSMRLPRYEMPGIHMDDVVYQREYKKTNPLEVYDDLVENEYGPGVFTDKRFAILYQLILFAAECLENGMTEEETLSSISSLKVVRRKDLSILREMAARYKGLSEEEIKLVKKVESLGVLSITNLYLYLIRQYKSTDHTVTLHQYIISVLLKYYKDSYTCWSLLKLITLIEEGKSMSFIEGHVHAVVSRSWFLTSDLPSVVANETYHAIDRAFSRLKIEHTRNIDMAQYHFKRDGLTVDLVDVSTFNKHIPKRFDDKGRFCLPVVVNSDEAALFENFEKRKVGDSIYMMFPIPAFTTKDIYGHLLICKKQMRKV